MEYQIISANSISALQEDVNALLAEGWQPTGGLLVLDTRSEESKRKFCQALIKPAA
jgi:hypothetical protein